MACLGILQPTETVVLTDKLTKSLTVHSSVIDKFFVCLVLEAQRWQTNFY